LISIIISFFGCGALPKMKGFGLFALLSLSFSVDFLEIERVKGMSGKSFIVACFEILTGKGGGGRAASPLGKAIAGSGRMNSSVFFFTIMTDLLDVVVVVGAFIVVVEFIGEGKRVVGAAARALTFK
jgi:hypothetical protein